MTRLRPRLARDAGVYPEREIHYRRPFLRLFAAGLLIFISAITVSITFAEVDDGLKRGDWLLPLTTLPTLGGFYLLTTSTLVVDSIRVLIRNPLRQVEIPLAHVKDVVPGSTLKVVTDYKTFWAWGVEAAKVQVATGIFGSQETLRTVILKAAATASADGEPVARYRFRPPDLLFVAYLVVTLACAVGLRLGYGVNG